MYGKMKNKDILITVNNLNEIDRLKRLGIKHFVYPLKDFCVGMPNTFLVSEIKEEGFIYINRILDNKGIDDLKEILNNLPKKIIGIIFDDLGILEIIKDLKVTKILYLSHFNTNLESSKIYLDYVDSVVVSSDITKEEMEYITRNIPNRLTVVILGFQMAMYSRRLLLNNYSDYHNVEKTNPLVIKNTDTEFLVYENEYGTAFYHRPLFNGLELLELPCRYYFINSVFLTLEDIEGLLNGKSNIPTSKGFLEKETIYKLKGDLDV